MRGDAVPPKTRQTQAERSALTRSRLMQATIDSLLEVGYRRTTIRVVEERSGCSRGAILNQFASRSELLIAAVQHIARLRMDQMRSEADSVAATEGVDGLIDLMCRQFTGPLFYSSLELWNAARTDLQLQEVLYEEERKLGSLIRQLVQEMFGIPPDGTSAMMGLDLTWQFMRGAAVTMILKHDVAAQQESIARFRALVRPLFEAEAGVAAPKQATRPPPRTEPPST
jgi:AcrR family transcriptional regulator